jgi:hypothetical protein
MSDKKEYTCKSGHTYPPGAKKILAVLISQFLLAMQQM